MRPYCRKKCEKGWKRERESDDRWQRGVNSLWCARRRAKQESRGKEKDLFGRNRQGP